MDKKRSELVAKVPQVTLVFWIVKILATTLGETGGDYLVGTAIFGVIFVARSSYRSRRRNFTRFCTG